MKLRLPPKNRNQGIYWIRYYLDNVDKPSAKPKITKQDEYRQTLVQMLDCFTQSSYPPDITEFILELERVLKLKRITSKHMEKITCIVGELTSKYKQEL
jgi:hypothetical protein